MPYAWIRALLFRLDPETAHRMTLRALGFVETFPFMRAWLRRIFTYDDPALPVRVFGLQFVNPLGLAAGYDKYGCALGGLACLGFGHVELGTVTPLPQSGNPRPRLFRLPEDRALINRMGFPNAGAEALLSNLRRKKPGEVVVGVNIGKGVDTPLEAASEDYIRLLKVFHDVADYLVVNVSSPNTIGLRRLQARAYLGSLLAQISKAREELHVDVRRRIPVLIKLAPDLTQQELEDAVGAIMAQGMDGIVATNTTIDRDGLRSDKARESGGLSGLPLRKRSTEMIRQISDLTQGRLPIIGVGGVSNAEHVVEKMDAGASLVQVYTGLVYQGPGLVRSVLKGLLTRPQK